MAIATDTISIYRGDTFAFAVTVKDYLEAAFDLTDYTMKITAKLTGAAAVIDEDFACTTDPTLGVAYGELTSVETDVAINLGYDYDIQISNTDTPPKVYTIAIGKLQIVQDIST